MAAVGLWDPKKGIKTEYFWNRKLTLTIPRVIIVQVWQLGLLFRALQVAVLVYFLNQMIGDSTWAYRETPSNRINAWIEGASARASWATTSSSLATSFPYCSGGSDFDFTFSEEFTYTNVHCEPLHPFEVASKLPQTTAISTVYLDITEEGWDCSAGDAAAKASACTSGGGTTSTFFGTQCVCTTSWTTYPVSTDQMSMAFAHRFLTSDGLDNLQGSSSLANDPLTTTTVEFSNGSTVVFQAGSTVRLTIADWLKAADSSLSLDSRNTAVPADITNSSRFPLFRTTGAVLVLDIEYVNYPEGSSSPEVGFNKAVRAVVRPKVEPDWAGLAVKAPEYEVAVSGSAGAQTYKKKLRYSQGLLFKFSGTGSVYKFDFNFAVTQLTNAVVLMGLASTIVILFAKHMWTSRKMISNKSTEKLAVGTRLAEIVLKTVTHANSFNSLKRDTEVITADDIMRTFNAAGARLTDEEAKEYAAFVLDRVNNDPEDTEEGKASMDFDEYIRGMEAGTMIKWDRFKMLLNKKLKLNVPMDGGKQSKVSPSVGTLSTTTSD